MAANANRRRGYPSARVFITVLHLHLGSGQPSEHVVVGMRCSRWPGCPGNSGILRALRARVHAFLCGSTCKSAVHVFIWMITIDLCSSGWWCVDMCSSGWRKKLVAFIWMITICAYLDGWLPKMQKSG